MWGEVLGPADVGICNFLLAFYYSWFRLDTCSVDQMRQQQHWYPGFYKTICDPYLMSRRGALLGIVHYTFQHSAVWLLFCFLLILHFFATPMLRIWGEMGLCPV